MSTFSQFFGSSGGGGGGEGPRNTCYMFNSASNNRSNDNSGEDQTTQYWTVPANFDLSVPLRVYVWGGGGHGGCYSSG